jgi:CrcB protein
MLTDFLAVGIGGAAGSCLRFALTKMAACMGVSFPLGTLLSNVIAGIAIGAVIGAGDFSPKTRLFITTGLLGGLSTFSTFSLETINLFSEGRYAASALNVLLNLGLSLFGVVLGMWGARSLKGM